MVTLELGGQVRTLRFAMSAWEALEESGHPIRDFLPQLQETPLLMQTIHRCVWAMLQGAEGGPSYGEVAEWIDMHNFADVVAKMGEAIRDGSPQEGSGNGRPPTGRGRTGARSRPSPTARLLSSPRPSGS